MRTVPKSFSRYLLEFLSILIAVLSAFALNNWNEARKARLAEEKILDEVYQGLQKDLADIDENMKGHQLGQRSVAFFREFLDGHEPAQDTLFMFYFSVLRDFVSVQNTSGYEALKSKGFEIVRDDSLRMEIIALYEYDYSILRKFEETYAEMQYHQNYSADFDRILTPYFEFDGTGRPFRLNSLNTLDEADRKLLYLQLAKVETNRNVTLMYYRNARAKVEKLIERIGAYRAG
jgi:hypothetical protein